MTDTELQRYWAQLAATRRCLEICQSIQETDTTRGSRLCAEAIKEELITIIKDIE